MHVLARPPAARSRPRGTAAPASASARRRGRRGCRRGTSRARTARRCPGRSRQKLLRSSSPSSGRSGLPMITGAIAADQPRKLLSSDVEQLVDVRALEAADVALVVDVARRRPDQHEPLEQLRRARPRRAPRSSRSPSGRRTRRRASRRRARPRPRRPRSRRAIRSRSGSYAATSERPAPTWSNSTTRWSASNAGATSRHRFWSQPKPWANTIGASVRPAGDPDVVALQRVHRPILRIRARQGFARRRAGAILPLRGGRPDRCRSPPPTTERSDAWPRRTRVRTSGSC